MSTRRDVSPRFGGKCAVSLFALTLVAFVAESQLTQVFAPVVRNDCDNLISCMCS